MSIIVVTGNPRSGTSMMMRMLEVAGIPCVYEQRANEFNPDGFYEHPRGLAGDFSFIPDGHAVKCVYMLPTLDDSLDVRVIIMRREISKSLSSMNRAAAARRDPPLDGYEDYLQRQIDSTRQWCAAKPHIEVWYEDMLRNTPGECLRVQRFLSLSYLVLADMAAVVRHG